MRRNTSGPSRLLLVLCALVCTLLVFGLALVNAGQNQYEAKQPMALSAQQTNTTIFDNGKGAERTKSLATPSFELHYSEPDEVWKDEKLLLKLSSTSGESLRAATRELIVSGYGSLANMSAIAAAVEKFNKLDILRWGNTHVIPSKILSAMATKHPSYRLYYDLPLYKIDSFGDRGPIGDANQEDASNPGRRVALRKTMLGHHNLYALQANIGYSSGDGESMPLIQDIITSSPNLRELDLKLSYQGGCLPGWPHVYAFDFTKDKAPRFPPLEVLHLSGYDLDAPMCGREPSYFDRVRYQVTKESLKQPWRHLPLPVINWFGRWMPGVLDSMKKDYEPPPWQPGRCTTNFTSSTNLDGWLRHMDWSKLRDLSLNRPSPATVHKLGSVLPSLSDLSVRGGDICTANKLVEFLKDRTQPLSALKLCNIHFADLKGVLEAINTVHNKTMTNFSLHEHDELRKQTCWKAGPENAGDVRCANVTDEYRTKWWKPHLYLSASQLQQFHESSPYVRDLTIDVDRNLTDADLDSVLSSLSTFLQMGKLTLHFESPSIEGYRNGSCDTYGSCHQYGLRGEGQDPKINTRWVADVFDKLREGQSVILGSDAVLEELEVFVGRYETLYWSSMIGPTPAIIGKFECKRIAGGADVDCYGGVGLPWYHGR